MSELKTEKCGVIGMIGSGILQSEFCQAFAPLQNRGEDAAGVVALDGKGHLKSVTSVSSIEELFAHKGKQLPTQSSIWLGHNRYATSAGTHKNNIQPFIGQNDKYLLALSHNGNLLTDTIASLGVWINKRAIPGTSDSALMTSFLLQQRAQYASWTETFVNELPKIQGSFSLAMVTEEHKLYAVRDPWGIRPLCLGQKNGCWIVASETTSLQAINAAYLRELQPGELLTIDLDGNCSSLIYALRQEPANPCVLEVHYFANSKHFDGRERIAYQREELGRGVAERFRHKNINVDCVVPVLNSGLHVAKGAATALDLPLINAVKVNGKKRTFIQNTDQKRIAAVNEKHVILPQEITGKNILLADDSLVRGISLSILVNKIWAAKPKSIHIILGSPPVVDTCDLGVDLPKRKELLAVKWRELSLDEIEKQTAEYLGVNSVTYSENLLVANALEKNPRNLCRHCFGGPHPVEDNPLPAYRSQFLKQLTKQKVWFLASGSGTNVENLLNSMQHGQILATPIRVVTNNPQAGVIAKAAKYGVTTDVLPVVERKKYNTALARHILADTKNRPDAIVLAGWMLVLSDQFIDKMQKAGIEIINIHPALLSGKGQNSLITSMGRVPEIRGAHAIETAYRFPDSSMPVSGVTVHRVLPQHGVDTGEVIIKGEVKRDPDEALATFEEHIHAVEYLIFPIALQLVLFQKAQQKINHKQSLKGAYAKSAKTL